MTERSPEFTPVKYKKNEKKDAPFYATPGSVGFDLATDEGAFFNYRNEIKRISTGLVIATPADHMLYITFRSSTPLRYGVIVLEGIIDEDYRGDDDILSLQVMSLYNSPTIIPAGTRLAQGIFIPIKRAEFVEVEKMGESRGGFGSTGI